MDLQWLRYLLILAPLGFLYHYVSSLYILENRTFIASFNHSELLPRSWISEATQQKLDNYCALKVAPGAENSGRLESDFAKIMINSTLLAL